MEMNIFLAQSNQTKIELEEMADVQRQIITPALSVPIIGIVQDGLLGAYNLTQQNMKVDWKSAMNIISYTSLDDFSSFKKEGDIAGADLFSLIIPSRINNSGNLEIKNGKIIKGALNKAALGAKKAHSLIHLIWDEYGFERTRQFIDDTQRLINNFNLWDGVSVGFGDLNIPEQVTKQLHELFETNKLEVDHMNTEIENYPDLIDPEILEQTISAQLGAVRDNASKIVMNNLKFDNNFNIMITSGSKGDASNMGQMVACLGQQMVEGKRIQPKFNGRALPYFAQGDNSALGRGFVQQPFMRGSHPVGFIFHNMASREGLIDTAIKSVTGDTPILIIENAVTKTVMIGEWIDQQLDNEDNINKVEHHVERDMELLKLNNPVFIPTCDEDGNVTWGEISAITRHDPGLELYEINTQSGRNVIVTESKSLLIWNGSKFQMMDTPNVKIGDFVPVTENLMSVLNENETNKSIQIVSNLFQKNGTIDNGTIKMIAKHDMYLINMILNTLGIFAEINGNELIIKGKWANIFCKTVLANATHNNLNCDYDGKNDVVLDKIIEINKIDVAKYPKVYDLTVPSTLNFGLANGLHVVDTAESGYIQRKLVKSMEDLSVKYDGTVRNANNTIVQFIYGDNGVDTTRQSIQFFKMLEMSNAEIATKVKFNDQEIKNFKNFSEKKNNEFYNELLRMRNAIRESRTKTAINNITFDSSFMLPVNIRTVINNIKDTDLKGDKLEPEYCLNRIDEILDYENTKNTSFGKEYQNKDSFKYKDEMLSKIAFKFSLYEFLAPKICIFEYGLNKEKFDKVCSIVMETYNKSIIEPGEMCGVIAAQSIGEPTTQIVRP